MILFLLISLLKNSKNYTRLRGVRGVENLSGDAFCPEDKRFVDDYTNFVKEIAKIGSDMLMLDDDFCLSVRSGLGCFCDRHVKLLEEEVGEKLEQKNLKNLFFQAGKTNIVTRI